MKQTKTRAKSAPKKKSAKLNPATEPVPGIIPNFAYCSIETTMVLTSQAGDVSVTIKCLPTASRADPEYHVTIDQTDLLNKSGITNCNDYHNVPLDLMALGLQSGETQFRWGALRKSGKIRILQVDEGVQLGRPKSSGWEWVDARAYTTAADKLNSEIEPWNGPSAKGPFVFMRFKTCATSFTVVHVQGRLRHDTIWSGNAKHAKGRNIYPDGTNVPPPIPPGSSVGD